MGKRRHIGEAVRFVRLSKGLDQSQVAAGAGVTDSFISLIEIGSRDPSWSVIQRICDALNVDLTLLAMLLEGDSEFVKPILPLAYSELARAYHERQA